MCALRITEARPDALRGFCCLSGFTRKPRSYFYARYRYGHHDMLSDEVIQQYCVENMKAPEKGG